MSIGIIKNQSVYFHGYDLTGRTNMLALDYSADMLENTVLNNTTHSRMGGLKMVTAQVEGFMGLDATDTALFNNIGIADKPFSFGTSGDSAGDFAYTFLANQGSMKMDKKLGEIYAFSVSAEANSKLVPSKILLNSKGTPLTATANGTALQLGAIASGKTMYASLHVLSVGTGSPTFDLVIESDATNSFSGSETSRITFDQFTSIGSQMKTLAGPITDTWWRPTFTIGGSSPSFGAVLVVGII